MRLRSLSLVAVMAMIVVSCGGGAPEAAGPSEGIQVHGDWTIDIYNEDGSLDDHIEFSNALTDGGVGLTQLLANDLGRYVASWSIAFGAAPGTSPCDLSIGDISANPDFQSGCSIDLADITVATDLQSFALSGSVEATQDGSIDWVETFVGGDGPNGFWFGRFTGTSVTEETVSAGQTVQVEVTISFTSG